MQDATDYLFVKVYRHLYGLKNEIESGTNEECLEFKE